MLSRSVMLVFLSLTAGALSLSPLRPGTDVDTNDLSISFNQNSQQFYFQMSNNFEFINAIYIMCFRERPVSYDTVDPSTCSLSNSGSSYSCLEFDGSGTTDVYYYFTLSSDRTTASSLESYTPNNVTTGTGYGSYLISLDGTISTGSIDYLPSTPSIYEVISNEELAFTDSTQYKINYANTGAKTVNISSQNIIMPQNFQCVIFNSQIGILIFYGGFLRISTPTMIYAIITYSVDLSTTFAAWQGISFSKSHAFRDMMAFIPHTGTLYDMFSLLASAPYDDTSSNINGLNDWVLIESSGQITKNTISWYYYTIFYRYYQTSSSGDQTIMEKIQNQHCMAIYFETGVTSFSALPTDNNYEHTYYQCYYPILTLNSQFIKFGVMGLLICFMLV